MDSDRDPFPFARESVDAAGGENSFGTNTIN